MAKKPETYDPLAQGTEPKVKAKAGKSGEPSADLTFQDQLAELEDTVGVAGTNMTAQEAADLVEAGEGDTLAEHGPETPPEPPPEDARKAFGHAKKDKDDSPF